MIESQYTSNLHKKLPSNIYSWKINDNFAGGVPDAFYRNLNSDHGRVLWIEYKFLKTLPKRETTIVTPKLSAQQLLWLQQAQKAGEQALVIIGVQDQQIHRQTAGFILHPSEWVNGITVKEAHSRLKSYDELAQGIVFLTR